MKHSLTKKDYVIGYAELTLAQTVNYLFMDCQAALCFFSFGI
jgi:hypothetical protein